MILVIDNYDSFTYNLVQYLGEMGQELVVRRNNHVTLDEVAAMAPERIVISPGPCTPTEAAEHACREGQRARGIAYSQTVYVEATPLELFRRLSLWENARRRWGR